MSIVVLERYFTFPLAEARAMLDAQLPQFRWSFGEAGGPLPGVLFEFPSRLIVTLRPGGLTGARTPARAATALAAAGQGGQFAPRPSVGLGSRPMSGARPATAGFGRRAI